MFGTPWALALAIAMQSAAATPLPARDPWPDAHPQTRLVVNLFHDLKSLPSANTAMVLTAGAAGAAAIHPADRRLADWSSRSGTPSYTAAGRVLGNGWVQSGAAVATYAAGRLTNHPQVTHIGSDLIRAQVLNAVITNAIKVTVDRTRPSGGPRAFPSGHTSATFASAAVLQDHYGWRVGAPAFAVAGFVAWTRTRDRAHWLSDVAFGSAIGIMSGRTVVAGHSPRRLTQLPAPIKGGAGLLFVLNRK